MRRIPFEILASCAIALVACFVEIAAVPGIESAAVFGVLLPPIVAAATALRSARERRDGWHDRATSVLRAMLYPSVAFVFVACISVARQLTDPTCFAWDGLPWLVFGPWPGMVLAALVGEACGRLFQRPRPRLSASLAVLVVFSAYVVVVAEIAATPAVFVFTIFGGHWPGPVYDEATTFPTTFVTYRSVTLLAIGALALALRSSAAKRAGLAGAARFLALLLAAGFAALTYHGAELGHRTSVARIDAALGGIVSGTRCVLHVPSEMPALERRRTLAECEGHVFAIERALHVFRRAPLHAFIYRSPEEKGALVGASDTYVAKPWRGEVHVQRESFPHQVLRHEIVHVIAAAIGPWPFRASGGLGGLLTNPQLVEGLAVALAPEPRDGLTPDQWSRAMLDLGKLPRALALAGAGFLGQGSGASYSASGSFIAYVLRARGASAMHRMYRRGQVGDTASLLRYERGWHAYLRTVALPPEALGLARQRLEDHGLFSTRCARLRARITMRMVDSGARDDHRGALASCRALLAIDARDANARAAEVLALARAGRLDEAESKLRRLSLDRAIPPPLLARSASVLGDRWFTSRRDAARASAHLRAALAIPASDDTMRSLEVRLAAMTRPEAERDAIALAVMESEDAPAEAWVALSLESVRRTSNDGVPSYLLGRRLVNAGRYRAAIPILDDAASRGLPTGRLIREAARLRALSLVASCLEGSSPVVGCLEGVAWYRAHATTPSIAFESQAIGDIAGSYGERP